MGTPIATVLASVETCDLLAELERRGVRTESPLELDQITVRLPGLVVVPSESRVVWRGTDYTLYGRPMETLYMLALARWQGRRRLRSDVLAAKVWRGWPKAESLPTLRQAVWAIRRVVPGLIVTVGGSGGAMGYYEVVLDADEVAA